MITIVWKQEWRVTKNGGLSGSASTRFSVIVHSTSSSWMITESESESVHMFMSGRIYRLSWGSWWQIAPLSTCAHPAELCLNHYIQTRDSFHYRMSLFLSPSRSWSLRLQIENINNVVPDNPYLWLYPCVAYPKRSSTTSVLIWTCLFENLYLAPSCVTVLPLFHRRVEFGCY